MRVFRLRCKPFTTLQTWLGQVESYWTDQFDAFKAHAESRGRRKRR